LTTAQLEAGKFEGVTTHDKTKRLNVPTPQFKSVEDYGSFAAKVGAQPRAFHRARVNKRTTLLAGRSLGGDDAAAAALGTATSSAADKAADEDEGLEYVLGVDDERWLLNELPTLVRKRLSGQTSAGGQVKGRSHKKGAGRGTGTGQRKRSKAEMDAIAAAEKLKEAEEAKKLAEEAKKLEKEREANGGGTRAATRGRSAAAGAAAPSPTPMDTSPDGAPAPAPAPAVEATDENVEKHVSQLTGDVLEALIDCLEMISGGFPNPTARAQQASDALMSKSLTCNGGIGALALKDAAVAGVLGPVAHQYWLAKRSKLGKPLLRRFWPKTAPTDTNPHCVFRPREKERYKLRKHRKNDVDAFRKLQQLRRDFEAARELCNLVARKEAVKRLKLDAGRGALRRTLDGLAASKGVEKLDASFSFADADADYKLTAKELKDASKALAEAKAAAEKAAKDEAAAAAAAAAPAAAPAAAVKEEAEPNGTAAAAEEPKPKKAKGPKRSPDDVVAAVLAERLAAVAVRPPVEEEVYDGGDEFGYERASGGRRKQGSARQLSPAALAELQADGGDAAGGRKRQRKKARKYDDDDDYADAPRHGSGRHGSNAAARAQANTPRTALGDRDGGRPCVPLRGFMDSAWWGRDDAALAALGEHRFLDPPIRADLAPVPPPAGEEPKPPDPLVLPPYAPPELVESLTRRRARVGRGGRVLVDRYRAHRVPKRAPVAASTTSSQSAQSASPRHGAAPANDLRAPNVRVSYAARARVAAPPKPPPPRRRARPAAKWATCRDDDGLSSSSSEEESVPDPPPEPPQPPPPPPPPPPPVVEVRPCAACRGAHSAHTCGTRGASAEAAAAAARESAERVAAAAAAATAAAGGAAAAPPPDAAAAARVDVGRTRGATQRLHAASDAWDAEPPKLADPPRPVWVELRDAAAAARAAPLPLRRPPTTIVPQRFAEICALSDSEEEDLYPIDAPDPAPSQLRVKFSVDV